MAMVLMRAGKKSVKSDRRQWIECAVKGWGFGEMGNEIVMSSHLLRIRIWIRCYVV